MKPESTEMKIRDAIEKIPVIDVHTHLNAAHLSARGLDDIMLYHMLITELYSAGCPSGSRLSDEPDEGERTKRIEEAIPYLRHITNTSIYGLFRTILKDLYAWDRDVTLENWKELDERIATRSRDESWAREVLNRANIEKSGTELALRGSGAFDDILFYALEWAFFTRNQWGVFDAPLYELEHAWQFSHPVRPLPVTQSDRDPVAREIETVADIHKAMEHYCHAIPFGGIASAAHHVSTDINYRKVTDEEMQEALDRRSIAGQKELDIYASYLFETYLRQLEKVADGLVYQFSLGAEPLPYETDSRLNQSTIRQLAAIMASHPKLHFQCFLSSQHANQSMITLSRELPNFSLAGYWWHNFFPSVIEKVMKERMEMLPLNKQIGFFSDGYCVEWCYAKITLVRKILAKILEEKVNEGYYSLDQAIYIAEAILNRTPGQLLQL